MNDLERLNDIAIEIKAVNEHIKWQNDLEKVYSGMFKADRLNKTTRLKIQITNLENRRKRIVRKMYNKYCK